MNWTLNTTKSSFLQEFNTYFNQLKIHKEITKGSFATCFSTNHPNTIVKTNIIDWTYKPDTYLDGFTEWIHISTTQQYTFLPQFYYQYIHHNYYVVVMEKLNIPKISTPINDILKNINHNIPHTFSTPPKFTNNYQKIIYNQLQYHYNNLQEVIHNTPTSKNIQADLNSHNIGLRKNNELVILDPFWLK